MASSFKAAALRFLVRAMVMSAEKVDSLVRFPQSGNENRISENKISKILWRLLGSAIDPTYARQLNGVFGRVSAAYGIWEAGGFVLADVRIEGRIRCER